METGLVEADIPVIDYGAMGLPVHRAVDRILSERGGASMRIDDVEIGTLEIIRGIFRANQGSSLPMYHYNLEGEYVQMGRTPVIEERHAQINVIERDGSRQDGSLAVRLPERPRAPMNSNQTEAPAEEITASSLRESLRTVRMDIALGGLCLAADGVGMYGMQTGKLSTSLATILYSAGMVGGTGVSMDAARRLLGPLSWRTRPEI